LHILLDAEFLAGRGRAEEPLYRKLQLIYHRANLAPPDADCGSMIREVQIVAAQYGSLDHDFGGKLANAAPNLFTFVSHPGMEPTNNTAEGAAQDSHTEGHTARATHHRRHEDVRNHNDVHRNLAYEGAGCDRKAA